MISGNFLPIRWPFGTVLSRILLLFLISYLLAALAVGVLGDKGRRRGLVLVFLTWLSCSAMDISICIGSCLSSKNNIAFSSWKNGLTTVGVATDEGIVLDEARLLDEVQGEVGSTRGAALIVAAWQAIVKARVKGWVGFSILCHFINLQRTLGHLQITIIPIPFFFLPQSHTLLRTTTAKIPMPNLMFACLALTPISFQSSFTNRSFSMSASLHKPPSLWIPR